MAIVFSPSEQPAQTMQSSEHTFSAARTHSTESHLGIGSHSSRLLSMTEVSPPESSGFMAKLKTIGSQIITFFQWIPTHVGSFFKSLFFVYSCDKSNPAAIQQRITEIETFQARLGRLGERNRYEQIQRAFSELSEGTRSAFYNFNDLEVRLKYGQLNNPTGTLVQEWIDECSIVLKWTRFFGEKLKGVAFQEPAQTVTASEPAEAVTATTAEPPPPTNNDTAIAQEIVRLNQTLENALGAAYDPPEGFTDPVSFLVMSDPVMDSCAAHGAAHYFERQNIEDIFTAAGNRLCPINRQEIPADGLADAAVLQRRIVAWLRQQAAALPPTT